MQASGRVFMCNEKGSNLEASGYQYAMPAHVEHTFSNQRHIKPCFSIELNFFVNLKQTEPSENIPLLEREGVPLFRNALKCCSFKRSEGNNCLKCLAETR